jgi:hypothetical protein
MILYNGGRGKLNFSLFLFVMQIVLSISRRSGYILTVITAFYFFFFLLGYFISISPAVVVSYTAYSIY